MNPIIAFWIGLASVVILGLGLLIDIVLAAIYWDKWARFFRENLTKVPWFLKDVLKICLILVFVYCIFYFVEYLILKLGLVTKERFRPIANVLNTLGIYGLSIWIIIRFLKQNYHVSWTALGIKWRSCWKRSLKSSLFYLGFIPILVVLTHISIIFCKGMGIVPEPHPLVEILKEEKSIWFISYLVIIAVFIAPIFEEIIFRGLIYQGLKKHMGVLKAVLVSSIIFSLLHFSIAQFLPILGLGVLLCFIFEHTGSLIPAIAIHMLNNGVFLGLFLILRKYI